MWSMGTSAVVHAHTLYTHAHRVVNIRCVEGNVDGKGGGVVVGSEAGLAVRVVLHNKVHHCMSLQKREGRQNVND